MEQDIRNLSNEDIYPNVIKGELDTFYYYTSPWKEKIKFVAPHDVVLAHKMGNLKGLTLQLVPSLGYYKVLSFQLHQEIQYT